MKPEYVQLHDEARREAVRLYARAYDEWATEEQVLVAEGRYVEAEGAHVQALIVLRAYQRELDDPEPGL